MTPKKEKENSWLIFYDCEMCGIMYKIYIRNNIIHISILDKLHSYQQIFNSNGYLTCIQCRHKNRLQIQKVY